MTISYQDSIQENQPQPIPLYQEQDFQLDGKEKCDLIMKGGVASGVLYPAAILELATKYRFHSIGGTSAGAIAAAAAAAAEYGRATAIECGRCNRTSGFMKLQELQQTLLQKDFLFKLFQPSAATRPLFDTLVDLYPLLQSQTKQLQPDQQSQTSTPAQAVERRTGGWLKRIGQIGSFTRQVSPILQRHNQAAFQKGRLKGLGLGLGLAIFFGLFAGLLFIGARLTGILESGGHFWLGVLLFGLFWSTLFGLLGWFIGGFGGALYQLSQIFLTKVANGNETLFGICTGSTIDEPASEVPPHPVLIDWLTDSLNELAGLPAKGDPLTFVHLKRRKIEFKLVTTNLSEAQPYIFPLRNGLHRLIFHEADMQKLFPEHVVKYLKEKGGQCIKNKQRKCLGQLPEGYYFLPKGHKLPVVVATRLSLSFPILLSAVRLYTIKDLDSLNQQPGRVLDPADDLREQWFSDGGIISNFPIHMFDAWRPTRPTFGIKLYGMLSADKPGAEGQNGDKWVHLPQPQDLKNGGEPIWRQIPHLLKFFGAIMDTWQNHRDNMQSILPGYRERIVQIYLAPDEGGLNLKMSPETIERVVVKGHKAAEALDKFNFEQHQWIRFRVLMAQIENQVNRLAQSIECVNKFGALREEYNYLFDTQLNAGGNWYKSKDEIWCKEAINRLDALLVFMQAWKQCPDQDFFNQDAPKPPSVLRVSPDL